MPYPWPFPNPDPVLQEALDIAMDYLQLTRKAFPETEGICAQLILQNWRKGIRHRIKLANDGITAIEKHFAHVEVRSPYPRLLAPEA